MAITIERKLCQAADGVMIVYSACGAGEPACVFIHGGLADRSFWDAQLKAFGRNHRVIALDLAGHGESGRNPAKWGLPEFGVDVKAVADAKKLKKIILFGNSLGGPVAIEAALLLPGPGAGSWRRRRRHVPRPRPTRHTPCSCPWPAMIRPDRPAG